jgi:hypothetical protein
VTGAAAARFRGVCIHEKATHRSRHNQYQH